MAEAVQVVTTQPQTSVMWQSGGQKETGYEVGGKSDATSYRGIGAMHRLITKLGLVEQIDRGLHLLKVHLPYHESDHVPLSHSGRMLPVKRVTENRGKNTPGVDGEI